MGMRIEAGSTGGLAAVLIIAAACCGEPASAAGADGAWAGMATRAGFIEPAQFRPGPYDDDDWFFERRRPYGQPDWGWEGMSRKERMKQYMRDQKEAQKEYWRAQKDYQKKLIKKQRGF